MIDLFIEGISHNGEGIARNAGKVIFIPYTIPGETVQAIISEDKTQYSRGILKDIILKSPYRVKAKCPYYYHCGGCSYQHVDYQQQLLLKQRIVEDALKRIGGVSTVVKPLIGMPEPWNYRNKVIWHLAQSDNGINMGFYKFRSNEIVDIYQCPLLLPGLNEVSLIIREMLHELEIREKTSIVIRQSNQQNDVMIEFINCLPKKILLKELSKKVQSIYVQQQGKLRLLFGKREIVQKAGHCLFTICPQNFFQTNSEQSERLIEIVCQYLNLSDSADILDAYCGVGMFSINIAQDACRVTGVDSNHSSIKNARRNAKINGLTNCQFIAGFCEKILLTLEKRFSRVIVDPPRAGLEKEFITRILPITSELIVYVSCNPATLARDIKQFVTHHCQLIEVQPLDMFPQTGNIENIALLQKD
jgi:23S rRNA (uracil1939-C5)-methyltransferase